MMRSLKGKLLERHPQRLVEDSVEHPVWLGVYQGIWDQLDTGEGFDLIREQIESALGSRYD